MAEGWARVGPNSGHALHDRVGLERRLIGGGDGPLTARRPRLCRAGGKSRLGLVSFAAHFFWEIKERSFRDGDGPAERVTTNRPISCARAGREGRDFLLRT